MKEKANCGSPGSPRIAEQMTSNPRSKGKVGLTIPGGKPTVRVINVPHPVRSGVPGLLPPCQLRRSSLRLAPQSYWQVPVA